MTFIQFICLVVAILYAASPVICEVSNNSSSTSYSQTSQVLLSPITFRVYFTQDTRTTDDFDPEALSSLEALSSEHTTNFTIKELRTKEIIYSVEEAVYAALYQETLLKVSSRSICSIYNWIVNMDCFSFELSPIVKYFDSEYFNQIGNTRFVKLINLHTVNSFALKDSIEYLASALLKIPSFNTSLEIRKDSVDLEEILFAKQFVPTLDPRLSYEQKKDQLYIDALKQPTALFLYIALSILAMSTMILIADSRYSRRNDLLKLHIQSVSRAMLEKRTSMEESMTSQSYDRD